MSAGSICLSKFRHQIAPEVGSIIPATSLDIVDFPDPIFPTRATFGQLEFK